MRNNNEFANLVKYLEEQQKRESNTQERVLKQEIKQKTKKIIEECSAGIQSDVPLLKKVKFSKGFDVLKFESLMRSKLIDSYKRSQSYERPYISVTELCSCIRKSYYTRLKYSIDLENEYQFAYLYLINKVGNDIHEVIQTLYDHTEVEKTIISEKYKVKGRVDGIRDRFLLEYKSIDAEKFKEKYVDEHYTQSCIYAYILNTEYNYKIDTITIVYIIRNLKRIIPFDLPIDNNRAVKFLNRSQILQSHLTKKRVPEPVGATKEQCKWCSYKKYCEEDGNSTTFSKQKEEKRKSIFLL